jgi:formylglycine-generating enzyme required for sulfatase activity
MRSFVAALVLAALWLSAAAAQPRTETLTGEIKIDSPKLAGRLMYACHEFVAEPGETVSIHMETTTGRKSWAGFYVLGVETCDPIGLGGIRSPWPRSKMMSVVDLSLKAEGGLYWIMVLSSVPGPHTLTIEHGANASKAVALKASVRSGAPALAQAETPLSGGAAPQAAPPVKVETYAGQIKTDGPIFSGAFRYDCTYLDTDPGDIVSVRMQPKPSFFILYVLTSETCDLQAHQAGGVVLASPATGAPSLTFKSSGGRYQIMTVSETLGPYALRLETGVNAPQAKTLAKAAPKPLPIPEGTAATTPGASAAAKAGQIFQDCPTCPKMVVVPAGSFMMGSASTEEGRSGDEGPRHPVTFARPFAIGAYEITFDEWDACVADNRCRPIAKDEGWGRGKRPVINISKADIQRYVGWLSDKTGHKYFLPSESEWEYAARAGTDTPWNTGDALIGDDANILDNFQRSVPVGSFPPNAFGLYDVHGNVAEWVQDCSDVGYFGVPTDGGAAIVPPDKCSGVLRGGHWNSTPATARSAIRQRLTPGPVVGGNATGFRVTRALD